MTQVVKETLQLHSCGLGSPTNCRTDCRCRCWLVKQIVEIRAIRSWSALNDTLQNGLSPVRVSCLDDTRALCEARFLLCVCTSGCVMLRWCLGHVPALVLRDSFIVLVPHARLNLKAMSQLLLRESP